MGININNLNSFSASSLSGSETVSDNLRELTSEELKTSGGRGGPIFADTGGPPPFQSTFVSGGSGGFGGGTGPIFVDTGGPPPFRSTFVYGGDSGFGFPVSGGFGVPVRGGSDTNINITNDNSSESSSRSGVNSY